MTVGLWKAYASPLLRARSDNQFSHLAQRHMLSALATWRKVPRGPILRRSAGETLFRRWLVDSQYARAKALRIVHAARRKLDDISGDKFIELARPTDQVERTANVLVCYAHGLNRFRLKSLSAPEWNYVQKWNCCHDAPPRDIDPNQQRSNKEVGNFLWRFWE